MIDAYKRKINYLRVSVTDLCNLRCKYCMPEGGILKKDHLEILSIEEMEEIIGVFEKMGITKLRFTGGEPLVKKGLPQLIRYASKLPNINDISITTNGILLEEYAYELKKAGLNRVNISLDSLNAEKFKEMSRGGNLNRVLSGIEKAREVGLTPIKINVVLIGGFNDVEIPNFIEWTKEGIDVRFIELMPIGMVANWAKPHFISNKRVLEMVPELERLAVKDKSATASYYKKPGYTGKVGLISPISCKFCQYCNRIRLTSDGKLRFCLHSDEELDLKRILENRESLENKIMQYIMQKPKQHQLELEKYIKRAMSSVGG